MEVFVQRASFATALALCAGSVVMVSIVEKRRNGLVPLLGGFLLASFLNYVFTLDETWMTSFVVGKKKKRDLEKLSLQISVSLNPMKNSLCLEFTRLSLVCRV